MTNNQSNPSAQQDGKDKKGVSNREKHNPFKKAGDKQTKEESSRGEAIAEQQRKEALTERD